MAPTAATLEEMTATGEDDARRRVEMTPGPVRRIHHQAYACWDSEETRRFYEDILEMPLIATVMIEDPFRTDGSGYCYTFFKIGDGDELAFVEHMSPIHPRSFNARSASHRHLAFEVEGEAAVQQFKRKLDAAGVANTLKNLGTTLSLRFNDPNGLLLEFTTRARRSLEYERSSRSCAHSELQRWLLRRQNWWRRRSRHESLEQSG